MSKAMLELTRTHMRSGGGGEESLFKADAVNEEPSATALPRCRRRVPPCYVPEGDSPLSLLATEEGGRGGGGGGLLTVQDK